MAIVLHACVASIEVVVLHACVVSCESIVLHTCVTSFTIHEKLFEEGDFNPLNRCKRYNKWESVVYVGEIDDDIKE